MDLIKRWKSHWMVIWLLQRYIKCRVWLGYYKRGFSYYFGAFAPLWVMTYLMRYYHLDQWRSGDSYIRLRHIEYTVYDKRYLTAAQEPTEELQDSIDLLEDTDSDNAEEIDVDIRPKGFIPLKTEAVTSFYCYDITARSAWYFSTIGNDYDGYMEYARYVLPQDLNEHLYDHPDNSVLVKYDTTEEEDDDLAVRTNTMILSKTGDYRLQINNTPFIVGSVTFNTLSFLLDAD